ncbi:hypothetical protein ACTFIY_004750 [Dictyostelium cf. discoideum]
MTLYKLTVNAASVIEEIIEKCKENKTTTKALIAQLKKTDKSFGEEIEKNDKEYLLIRAEFKSYGFNEIYPIARIIQDFEKAVDYLENGTGQFEEYEFTHQDEIESYKNFQKNFRDGFEKYLKNQNFKRLSILKRELENISKR